MNDATRRVYLERLDSRYVFGPPTGTVLVVVRDTATDKGIGLGSILIVADQPNGSGKRALASCAVGASHRRNLIRMSVLLENGTVVQQLYWIDQDSDGQPYLSEVELALCNSLQAAVESTAP